MQLFADSYDTTTKSTHKQWFFPRISPFLQELMVKQSLKIKYLVTQIQFTLKCTQGHHNALQSRNIFKQ